jgi:hypothetical protein
MIVSHRHRFIHIKGHKVGGSSVELALAKHCGPEDIIHPIPPFDPLHDETEYEWATQNCGPKADSHMVPGNIEKLVGPDVWRNYRKIVEVRDPWDMLVSYFFWWVRLKKRVPRTFERFVPWHCTGKVAPVNEICCLADDEEILADSVIRFESLAKDTERVFNELGLPFDGLPRLKTKRPSKTTGVHYSHFYMNWMRMAVGTKYRRTVKCFDYKFEDRRGPSRRR